MNVYAKDETLSCAVVYENNTSKNVASIYKNGSPINMEYGNDYWPATNNVVLGGGRPKSGELNFLGNIYSVRAYSRALTASEIAHNYAVDKTRFNLP